MPDFQSDTRLLTARHLHPRFWGLWLGLGVAWLVTRSPHRFRLAVGSAIGTLGYHLADDRRHIVTVNLELCYPEKSDAEREQMVRDEFRSVGMSLIETCFAWLQPPSRMVGLFDMHGIEHVKAAAEEGRGVILLGMHMATLDVSGVGLSRELTLDVMYRRHKNPLMEAFMTRGRERLYPSAIERGDVKQVIRNLRKGHVVWYGPDQDYGRKHSVFAPFFGVQAASITATARIAKITKSPIIVFYQFRKPDGTGYELHFEPLTETFPVEDDVENATIVNQQIERAIRIHPDQYWWLHRRFKTRPEGEARPY